MTRFSQVTNSHRVVIAYQVVASLAKMTPSATEGVAHGYIRIETAAPI